MNLKEKQLWNVLATMNPVLHLTDEMKQEVNAAITSMGKVLANK